MNAPLYNLQILRLAAETSHLTRLTALSASVERRSPVCGSRVIVDVALDAGGRVSAVGMAVSACALGQASATLMSAHLIGRDRIEIVAARDALADWLSGERADAPEWPGIDVLAAALPHKGRHAAILLPFEAAADAITQAER